MKKEGELKIISKKYSISALLLFALSLLLLCSGDANAGYQTNLFFSGYIQDGSGDIDVGEYSVPVVYDWNNDGNKDLLVGQNNEGHGYVSYYQNIGSNDAPVFGSSTYIQACAPCSPLDVASGG